MKINHLNKFSNKCLTIANCGVFVRAWAGLGSVFAQLGWRKTISLGLRCLCHVLALIDVLRVVLLNLLRFEYVTLINL